MFAGSNSRLHWCCWYYAYNTHLSLMGWLCVYPLYMDTHRVWHFGPSSFLSKVSSAVQSLQTPVSEPLRLGALAAWWQGLEAPVHTGLHCTAICRLDHWAAGTRPRGWLLPWGNSGGRMTGRDDVMSGILNSLTGNTSNCKGIRLAKKKTLSKKPVWGWNFLLRGLMWTRKILDSSVQRKCAMSSRLWGEFVFGHLCSASASVSCWGLNPDTRSRPGLFSFREPTEGAVGNRAGRDVFSGNGNGLPIS